MYIAASLPKALYLQIADEIRRLIAIGELLPHAALPSVRQLAGDLRLNHNTVVQAYRTLELDGVVYVKRGQGTFVAAAVSIPAERERIAEDLARQALAEAHRSAIHPAQLLRTIAKVAGVTIESLSKGKPDE